MTVSMGKGDMYSNLLETSFKTSRFNQLFLSVFNYFDFIGIPNSFLQFLVCEFTNYRTYTLSYTVLIEGIINLQTSHYTCDTLGALELDRKFSFVWSFLFVFWQQLARLFIASDHFNYYVLLCFCVSPAFFTRTKPWSQTGLQDYKWEYS